MAACARARSFDGNRRTIVDLAATRLALAQAWRGVAWRGVVSVHDELVTIAAFHRGRTVLQEAFGHHEERIGTTRRAVGAAPGKVTRKTVPFPRRRTTRQSRQARLQ